LWAVDREIEEGEVAHGLARIFTDGWDGSLVLLGSGVRASSGEIEQVVRYILNQRILHDEHDERLFRRNAYTLYVIV